MTTTSHNPNITPPSELEPVRALTAESVHVLGDEALLDLLFTEEDRLPRCVVDEIAARGERFMAPLIAVLQDPKNWDVESAAWWAPVHATFILGAIDEAGADAALVSVIREAHKYDYDWIMSSIAAILGHRGARIRPLLMSIIMDRNEDWLVRFDAMFALAATTLHAAEGAQDVFAAIASVFLDPQDDALARGSAGTILLDFQLAQYRDALAAFAEDETLHDSEVGPLFSREQVDEAFVDQPHTHLYADDWLEFYSEKEIAERQARWLAQDSGPAHHCDDPHCGEPVRGHKAEAEEERRVPVRSEPKVGRNDPCPCGSGKKYKKCCAP